MLVSVIVAAYNIEQYIERCVNSILNSTYSKLQVIVIEDGSSDNTGNLVDNFQDGRLQVVHTSNRGVSAARNLGLDRAEGEYILFVDGDDYIDSLMIEEMVEQCGSADIVETTQFFASAEKIWRKPYQTSHKINGIDLQEHKEACLYLTLAPHSRLYKKELLAKLRFPLGLVFEDNYFISMLFPKLHSVVKLETEHGYYHYQRSGSTTLTFDERIFDMLPIQKEIISTYKANQQFDEYYPILEKNAVHDLLYSTIGRKFGHYQGKRNLKEQYQEIIAFIKETYPAFKQNPYLSNQEKIVCSLIMRGYGFSKIVNVVAKVSGH